KQAGIVVEQGILEEECDGLNQVFFHYISTGRPYVVMKYAMTLDGKIATKTGASKWITGEEARRRVHEDRHNYSGILVGVGTVIADDPLLTCRLPKGKNPVRIICDSKLRTPLDAQVVVTAGEIETIIATCSKDQQKQQSYEAAGCTVLVVPDKGGRVALKPLLEALGKRKIDSVLLEGGGTLNGEALAEGIVDKVQAYISPKIFGGEKAKSPVGGRGVGLPAEAYRLEKIKVSTWGEDLLLEGEVKR
ncbi:MAG: bifunctional diaminohydroxyphosphoribosylaminopyrimidine deaminase/5-amino-6-(5-phosphoribosylamino)uracil reductase RibD, partial [Anaerovoracaceae bacterium]